MDPLKINQISQPVTPEKVQDTRTGDDTFKFMLTSSIQEKELQEKLTS